MNAKKLDIDFGGDDFFDSFGMADAPIKQEKASAKNDNPFDVVSSSKKEESGPFQLGNGTTQEDQEFVKNKLKELQGK